MSCVIGIDIGTYASKGVIVQRDGTILASATTAHRLEIPRPGWAEHDAEHTWWRDTVYLVKTLLQQGRERHGLGPDDVKAVGFSTIAPAVVPIRRDGEPLRKAILYGVDTRASEQIAELNARIGEPHILRTSSHPLSSQSAGPKILWIKEHEPHVYNQTYKFLSGTGYLVFKLTGNDFMDYYTAAAFSPLFHMDKLTWHESYTEFVTDLDRLPQLAWSHEIVGEITQKAAAITGLRAGTKVINGTADALAESISVGAVNEGDFMLMYGSSTFFIQVVDKQLYSDKFWPSIHAVPGWHTVTGGTSTAGSLTRWFVDQWVRRDHGTLTDAYQHLTRLASDESVPGSRGLIALPYFSGERTPIHDVTARGVFFGLTLRHTTADMYRAILEGVGYAIRHNMEELNKMGVKAHRVIAIGGGTKSSVWLQSVSNICRLQQLIPTMTFGASYGDAFLAALGLGWYAQLREVSAWIDYETVIDPDEAVSDLFDAYFTLYKRLYHETKALMFQLKQLEERGVAMNGVHR